MLTFNCCATPFYFGKQSSSNPKQRADKHSSSRDGTKHETHKKQQPTGLVARLLWGFAGCLELGLEAILALAMMGDELAQGPILMVALILVRVVHVVHILDLAQQYGLSGLRNSMRASNNTTEKGAGTWLW